MTPQRADLEYRAGWVSLRLETWKQLRRPGESLKSRLPSECFPPLVKSSSTQLSCFFFSFFKMTYCVLPVFIVLVSLSDRGLHSSVPCCQAWSCEFWHPSLWWKDCIPALLTSALAMRFAGAGRNEYRERCHHCQGAFKVITWPSLSLSLSCWVLG